MEIDQLELAEPALSAAILLQLRHPTITFTSGRRGVVEQARSMAKNVLQNRRWIDQTYADTAEARALQAWVDDNPGADTAAALQAGFEAIMRHWTDHQKGNLSKHFCGLAWDVQPLPPGPQASAVKAAIRALPELVKFLEVEGGLVRWHAQFE